MMKESDYINRLGILVNTVNEQIILKGALSISHRGQTTVYTTHKTKRILRQHLKRTTDLSLKILHGLRVT